MAPNLNMAALIVAFVVLASAQAQGWATVEDEAADMVPVSPVGNVMVDMPGGDVGAMLSGSICLPCNCCSSSNPHDCKQMSCCSTSNCNTDGNCRLVLKNCSCNGCGHAN
ncbi:hypothetical protein PR202_ga29638 [Eleusine coracana subsp. coracana]|uniref:Uncharacterized protein n=1 Tax=Eleusine coracana subsp. coracana TaxID=191504 RepID=A0AAV5DK40_ELECO|nr:hypothetical protein QOZ80_7AG0571360 [Eleusine coracana subsp. coracana]GJN11444.1 hypothetical protein PR202_ga29638 [Eleusine coracana subsp. coracana]